MDPLKKVEVNKEDEFCVGYKRHENIKILDISFSNFFYLPSCGVRDEEEIIIGSD